MGTDGKPFNNRTSYLRLLCSQGSAAPWVGSPVSQII